MRQAGLVFGCRGWSRGLWRRWCLSLVTGVPYYPSRAFGGANYRDGTNIPHLPGERGRGVVIYGGFQRQIDGVEKIFARQQYLLVDYPQLWGII